MEKELNKELKSQIFYTALYVAFNLLDKISDKQKKAVKISDSDTTILTMVIMYNIDKELVNKAAKLHIQKCINENGDLESIYVVKDRKVGFPVEIERTCVEGVIAAIQTLRVKNDKDWVPGEIFKNPKEIIDKAERFFSELSKKITDELIFKIIENMHSETYIETLVDSTIESIKDGCVITAKNMAAGNETVIDYLESLAEEIKSFNKNLESIKNNPDVVSMGHGKSYFRVYKKHN